MTRVQVTNRTALWLGFSIAICVLLANGLLAYFSTRRLAANIRLVAHSEEVRGQRATVLGTVADVVRDAA